MTRQFSILLLLLTIHCYSFGQNKTLIGIVPFSSLQDRDNSNSSQYSYYSKSSPTDYKTAVEDAVSEAFLNTKRFSLVEREKMDQLKSEKTLQKDEDFIDGQVIEQSKSLGAQYIVLGNISKANIEQKEGKFSSLGSSLGSYAGSYAGSFVGSSVGSYAGSVVGSSVGSKTTQSAEIAFSIRVVDVATGEIIASNSFDKSSKGKNAFEDALKNIKPQIETFIKDNFKIIASIVSVEKKESNGDATKVLISGGSSTGVEAKNEFKVYEVSELIVDGKKLIRKKPIGKVVVAKVEDENFSICTVKEGGADITKQMDEGAAIKCELINE